MRFRPNSSLAALSPIFRVEVVNRAWKRYWWSSTSNLYTECCNFYITLSDVSTCTCHLVVFRRKNGSFSSFFFEKISSYWQERVFVYAPMLAYVWSRAVWVYFCKGRYQCLSSRFITLPCILLSDYTSYNMLNEMMHNAVNVFLK